MNISAKILIIRAALIRILSINFKKREMFFNKGLVKSGFNKCSQCMKNLLKKNKNYQKRNFIKMWK